MEEAVKTLTPTSTPHRYRLDPGAGTMRRDPSGRWVRADEHALALEAVTRTVVDAVARAEAAERECERLRTVVQCEAWAGR